MNVFKTAKRALPGPPTLRKGHYVVVEEAAKKYLVLTPEGQTAFPREKNAVLGAIIEIKRRRLTPQTGQRVFKLSETIALPTVVRFFGDTALSALSRTRHVVVTPLPPGQEKLRNVLLARLLQRG